MTALVRSHASCLHQWQGILLSLMSISTTVFSVWEEKQHKLLAECTSQGTLLSTSGNG